MNDSDDLTFNARQDDDHEHSDATVPPSEGAPSEDAPSDGTPSDDALPSVPVTLERVLEILEKGEVTEQHGMIRWSSNGTFLLSLTHDDMTVMSVYKPRRDERPLWDFPDGTLAKRERAAFLTSQALGWDVVPPTALREGPRGLGSMQFFIDHDPNYHYFEFAESLRPQVARLAVFDVIINNADRKGGHCLVDDQDHVWGIDQGLTFNFVHKLRTVIWEFAGNPVPAAFLEDVDRLCHQTGDRNSDFRKQLEELLGGNEIAAFEKRMERLLKTGIYPKPGPGPNYPWPPV